MLNFIKDSFYNAAVWRRILAITEFSHNGIAIYADYQANQNPYNTLINKQHRRTNETITRPLCCGVVVRQDGAGRNADCLSFPHTQHPNGGGVGAAADWWRFDGVENRQAVSTGLSKNGGIGAPRSGKQRPPHLKNQIDAARYDHIVIGFPTWEMQLPPPVKTFLATHNLQGKTVLPLNTNAGYGAGSSFDELKALCSGGKERDGVLFVMQGAKRQAATRKITQWLTTVGENHR